MPAKPTEAPPDPAPPDDTPPLAGRAPEERAPDDASTPATPAATAEPEPDESLPPVELRYVGGDSGGRVIDRVPADDLTGPQIDRVVYVFTIPEPGSPGLRPDDKGFDKARGALVTRLVASGVYEEA